MQEYVQCVGSKYLIPSSTSKAMYDGSDSLDNLGELLIAAIFNIVS